MRKKIAWPSWPHDRPGSDFPDLINIGHQSSDVLIEYDVFIVRCWTHACKIFVL